VNSKIKSGLNKPWFAKDGQFIRNKKEANKNQN